MCCVAIQPSLVKHASPEGFLPALISPRKKVISLSPGRTEDTKPQKAFGWRMQGSGTAGKSRRPACCGGRQSIETFPCVQRRVSGLVWPSKALKVTLSKNRGLTVAGVSLRNEWLWHSGLVFCAVIETGLENWEPFGISACLSEKVVPFLAGLWLPRCPIAFTFRAKL